ncbi:hypothetical protein BG590_12975 [Mannheimia haemolytica]|nr:hypothetical protein D648_23740 [Mannheimia haemolytica USDA-ARS-USMARC-185]AGQ26109.1 hypothetical protein F382_09195 [Mannheimia haemolytica D153]AGQ38693.1 hypothetical protein J450_06025 [Mannheimia haemolytica D171]AGQ41235.1 hypothetical protein J451_07040 [Mannheimia haemolytica D174]AGR76171.1 hypothetical protein N220_13035 [Mannheimia haemolytica USMARC_2286]AKA10381.1 hypothetical protein WC39_01230 [Mannheimia haemolytica]ASW16604.1 hypothetical protein D650_27515 [Mannheimia h
MVSLSPLMGERQAKDLFRILWQREGDASGVNLLNFCKNRPLTLSLILLLNEAKSIPLPQGERV